MRRAAVTFGVVMGGLVLASAPACAQQQSSSEVLPSIELPADVARVLRDYERHWQSGQADSLSALFVEEGLIVRNGTWIRGRTEIRDAYQSASGPLQLRAVDYRVGERLAYIQGAYGYSDAPPAEDRGLFVLTLERAADGRWLIVSDMDRSGG